MIGSYLFMMLAVIVADGWTVRSDQLSLPDVLSESVRNVLEDKASTVKDGETEIMSLWFRKSIPSKATEQQLKNGLTYRELPETVIVGAVKLTKPFVDYRKQEIPAGVYTLRLGFQPENGDHMDTAPHTEFLLLSPASDDQSIEEMDLKSLVKLSKKATGGDHPAVMLLFPIASEKVDLGIAEKEGNVRLLQIKRNIEANGKTTQLGFGITIAGKSKTR